jgi:hypothetical protein
MSIMTCDQEWSHEELYGVVYDNCYIACKHKIKFLLDDPKLTHPDNLRDAVMDALGDHNLVDKYDALYASKDASETSDDVFDKWDLWIQNTIQEILQAHKYKGYIGDK